MVSWWMMTRLGMVGGCRWVDEWGGKGREMEGEEGWEDFGVLDFDVIDLECEIWDCGLHLTWIVWSGWWGFSPPLDPQMRCKWDFAGGGEDAFGQYKLQIESSKQTHDNLDCGSCPANINGSRRGRDVGVNFCWLSSLGLYVHLSQPSGAPPIPRPDHRIIVWEILSGGTILGCYDGREWTKSARISQVWEPSWVDAAIFWVRWQSHQQQQHTLQNDIKQ